MRSDESGFVMMAVMFFFALLITGATVMVTLDVRAQQRARIDGAHQALSRVDSAVAAFYADSVNMYPQSLVHLTRPISNPELNSCGNRYNDNATRWRGPYLAKVIEAGGLRIGIGTAQELLSRTNTNPGSKSGGGGSGQTSDILFEITEVREQDLLLLDALVDGDPNRISGRLRWDQPDQSGFTTAQYRTVIGTIQC